MLLGAAVAAACFYLAGLFWLAAWRDRTARTETTAGGKPDFLSRHAGLIYGLSLAVYCTSWTFFGGVGTAATAGLDYLPIYLGPILVFTVGFGLVRSILAQSKAQHSTSIADFLSARYGKSASVAAMVTIIATMGSLPYMALQLQSVGASLLTLSPELLGQVAADELVLLVAGSMALFAILFGSRRADRAGDNAGMVLTIAVEAVVKLVALIAVAVLALMVISGAQGPAIDPGNVFSTSQINARFVTLTLIAACAALCLPRQFHMSFVEAGGERATPAMQWVFPAYLLVTAIIIIPIVLAGLTALPAGTDPDTIVLALPLAAGNEALALLVFIGGFSASAGMIVVASVALSTMITNDIIAPLAFRRALSGSGDRSQIAERLLMVRRLVIAALLFFAYLFYLGFGALGSLAGLGTLAFAAAAQFAPGLVLGMVSRAGNKAGMLAGLGVGVALWLVLLILPAATEKAPIISIHPDPLVSGVMLSLGANLAAYWIGSSMRQASLVDAAQAAAFVGTPMPGATPRLATNKRVADVRLLLTQFVGREHADRSIAALCGGYSDNQPADQAVIEMAERTISGVIGTPSARMLVGSWSDGDPIPLAEVVAMFDETNRRLSFSAELLQIAIENIDQGVALVDAEMRLVAWNRRYQELFDLPEELVCVGTPIAELIRFNLKRTDLPSDVIEQQVTRRLEHMRAGREHRIESEQSDGRIMRIVGTPTPGGGYTTSYTDITEDRPRRTGARRKGRRANRAVEQGQFGAVRSDPFEDAISRSRESRSHPAAQRSPPVHLGAGGRSRRKKRSRKIGARSRWVDRVGGSADPNAARHLETRCRGHRAEGRAGRAGPGSPGDRAGIRSAGGREGLEAAPGVDKRLGENRSRADHQRAAQSGQQCDTLYRYRRTGDRRAPRRSGIARVRSGYRSRDSTRGSRRDLRRVQSRQFDRPRRSRPRPGDRASNHAGSSASISKPLPSPGAEASSPCTCRQHIGPRRAASSHRASRCRLSVTPAC